MENIDSINAYFKIIDISRTQIHCPKDLYRAEIKDLGKITDSQLPYISLSYFPILLSLDDKSFDLAARFWCYQCQVEHKITKILFLVLRDKTFLDYFKHKIESREATMIQSLISSLVKLTSKATIARHKAISAHRQCPFCGEALMAERGIPKPDKNGFYRIHCFNATKQNRCDFYSLVTKVEYQNFVNYEFNTNDHITLVPDKKCPKCDSQLYLRILHLPDGQIAYYEICRNYLMSTKLNCTYKVKLPEAPKWLKK